MNDKKLYRIKNGSMIAGVCNGLAQYLNMDVGIVRILAVIIACTTGVGLIAYIAAALVLPEI